MSRPRIRYMKPELWQSRDFLALSPVGRLTFLALISNADDEGRLKTDPGHLTTTYLVGCHADEIAAQLGLMEQRGMVVTYQVRGVHLVALQNWAKHQRVSHATASTLPPPSKFKRRVGPNKRQLDLDSLASAPEDSRPPARLRTSSSSSSSAPSTARARAKTGDKSQPTLPVVVTALVSAYEQETGSAPAATEIEWAHAVPYEYPRLSTDEVVAEYHRIASKFKSSDPPKRPPVLSYLAGRLRDLDARKSDQMLDARQSSPTLERAGDVAKRLVGER